MTNKYADLDLGSPDDVDEDDEITSKAKKFLKRGKGVVGQAVTGSSAPKEEETKYQVAQAIIDAHSSVRDYLDKKLEPVTNPRKGTVYDRGNEGPRQKALDEFIKHKKKRSTGYEF